MTGVECAERHDRLMDWAEIGLRLMGLVSGLGALAVLSLLAKYFADNGAPTQGAGILGVGVASIIGTFIASGRFRNRE
jgi:hypothetical protein